MTSAPIFTFKVKKMNFLLKKPSFKCDLLNLKLSFVKLELKFKEKITFKFKKKKSTEFLNSILECWRIVKFARKRGMGETFETMMALPTAGVNQSTD